MNLTSVRRVKYALGVDNTAQDHIIARLVGSTSTQITHWLRRKDQADGTGLQRKSRVEYIDPAPGERTFWPLCYPISSITAIASDPYGMYAGAEQTLDDDWYHLGSDSRTFTFIAVPTLPDWSGLPCVPRGMRLTYVAGLSPDPVRSTWTATGGATLTAGKYIQGEDSLAVGRIIAADADSIEYECLAGQFQAETVTEYARWNFTAQNAGPLEATGATAVLTAVEEDANDIPQLSLAEAHPALVEACEMHVAFLLNNRNKFENLTVTENGATKTSRADLKNRYEFLPEIIALLQPYRNALVEA